MACEIRKPAHTGFTVIKFIILAINLALARNILLTNATEGHAERAELHQCAL